MAVSLYMFSFWFLVAKLSVSFCQSHVYGKWENGTSYFFDQSSIDNGACSYGSIATSTFPFGHVTAANYIVFNDSSLCGACYQVECLNQTQSGAPHCCNSNATSVTVQVTDSCVSSACDNKNYFGLSKKAFSVIANTGCGIIPMKYRRVSCDFTTHIKLVNKDGINSYWYAVYVENVAGYGSLKKVEISDSNNTWMTGVRSDYNFYEFSNANGWKTPLSVRITDSNGNMLTSDNVVTDVNAGSSFDFGQNF